MKHHVIYVPGIRDDLYKGQSTALHFWRLWGIYGHLHAMPWAGDEDYQPKFKRLLKEIDKHLEEGHIVSLLGASAGASAVLHAYSERKDKISAVVYICGKINRPEEVSQYTYRANPAFHTVMNTLQDVLKGFDTADKAKFLSLYSSVDVTVPHADTMIPGVKERKLPPLNHGLAIIYSLTLGARSIALYLKQQAKPHQY